MAKRKIMAELPVLRVGYPQRGESRFGSTPVRFKGGIPGQRIMVEMKRKKAGAYEARILETTRKAEIERRVPCKPFGICGGCAYQTLYYPDELALKELQLRELYKDIAPLEAFVLHPSPKDRGYRNKMEYTFGDAEKGGPLELGLHRRGRFYEIVDTDTCNIVDPDFEIIRKAVLAYFRALGTSYYRKSNHIGVLRHLVIRASETQPQILVQLVTSSQEPIDGAAFVEYLQRLRLASRITGVLHTINDNVADTVQEDETRILFGTPHLTEVLFGLTFRISPASFFQTNTRGAEVLYGRVRELCGDLSESTVFDLYSGTGTIAQLLAPLAKRVIGVEIVPEAVQDARRNAAENGIKNVKFIEGDVFEMLDLIDERADLIVVDPPRSGMHPRAIPRIARYEAPAILYVSCNPITLVRDLESFRAWGYAPAHLEAVDMFPRTPHVESVVVLHRT